MKNMLSRSGALLALALAICSPLASAQTLEVFAGGRIVDNLPALDAPVTPKGIIAGADGTVFFLDGGSSRILRRHPSTTVLTGIPAGAPQYPYERITHFFRGNTGAAYVITNGEVYQLDLATGNFAWMAQIEFTSPLSCSRPGENAAQFAADSNGVIYWADFTHNSVCRLLTSGVVEKFAGATGFGFTGDGGPVLSAKVNTPSGIAIDAANNIYFSDAGNHRIRKVTAATGIISTVAGNGSGFYSGENVPAATSSIATPEPLLFDATGSLYFGESGSIRLRRIDAQTGLLTTIAGNGQSNSNSADGGLATQTALNWLSNFAIAANGDVLFADANRLRKVTRTTGIISTIAGNGFRYSCGDNGPPLQACLDQPRGVAVAPNGDVYIADTASRRVRKVTAATGLVSTVAGRNGPYGQYVGEGGPATNAVFATALADVALDAAGNLYIAGDSGNRLHRVDRVTGIITTVAGSGVYGFSGDGGPATAAQTRNIVAVVVDASGNIFFADRGNNRVRRVDAATGIITTYAGAGAGSALGDGGPAASAGVPAPVSLAFDPSGNLLIAGSAFRIRKVDRITGIITTVAGNGAAYSDGPRGIGGPATSASIGNANAVISDPRGNIFMYIGNGSVILRVDATSGILTQATPSGLRTPDGRLIYADDMEFDSLGRVYLGGYEVVQRVLGLPYGSSDVTPPSVTSSVTGTQGLGGWYRSDVQVSWTVSDTETAVSSTGCTTSSVTSDTSGVTFTCSATSEGGTTTKSVTIRRDTVAPEVAFGAAIPAANADGWNSTDVNVPFTASDALSGVFSTSSGSPVTITGEGAGLTRQLTVTDGAGNSTIYTTPAVNIDRNGPTITPNLSGRTFAQGWYVSDVQVTWTVTDPSSPITSRDGCDASSVTTDTTGITFTCTATSTGGSTTKSVTVKRDVTPPTIEFGTPTSTSAPNEFGWYNGDVSIPFTTADATSGVGNTIGDNPAVFTVQGEGLFTWIRVYDRAGNTALFETPRVNIDRTPPVIFVSYLGTKSPSGWYTSDVTVDWTVADGYGPSSRVGCDDVTVTEDVVLATYTCTATSAGGTATRSVFIRRDATPPQLEFGAPTPAANAAGWHNSDVSIPFTTSDATSGIATTSTSNPLLIAGVGVNLTSQVVITDFAGNSATFTSPAVNIDRSAPSVIANVSGTAGTNGWYTSDIHVAWNVSDDQAPIDSTDGCDAHDIVADTAGITFTCTANSAGGSTTKSVTVKRDATPPQLAFSAPSPSPNAVGWFGSDVSFAFSASDAVSGVASTSRSSPVVITGDGPNLGAQVVVTDGAGNSATFSTAAVSIDRSPPTVQASIVGTVGNNGWYSGNVQVSWAINESPASLVSSNGCGASSVVADTAGVTFTCSVVSGGGTASSSVTVKRDATPPVLTFGTPSPAPNVNGWNKTNVSIPFTRSDAMSGLASTSTTSPIVFNTEGAGQTRQVVVTDLAGNSATYTTVPRNIDKAAPYAEIQVPVDGQTYGFYADVVAQYECVDLSLVSCTGPAAIGELVNTKTAGSRTFKITAKDQSLFTTTHTHTFNVASAFNFDGFLGAANDPPTLNLVARGSLVPIRFRLPDGRGGYVANTAAFSSATVTTLTCGSAGVSPLNDTASGPAGISYDAGTNLFTYNWQTTASWTGCRKLVIKLKDNSTHELRFKFQ